MATNDAPLASSFAGLEDDPEVKAAIKSLALFAISQARELIETAAPQQRISLIRQLLPPLAKSLAANQSESDAMVGAQGSIAELYTALMSEWSDR